MNETTPFLSIIVPAYNIEDYINQCIDSILKQTYTDFELIIVDDGSTDLTADICDKYAAMDKRIHIQHKKNGGLVSARKAGLEVARGEYAAYVDGDDWVCPDIFQKLCDKAIETGADMVIGDFWTAGSIQTETTQNMSEGLYHKEDLKEKVYPYMLSKGEYFSHGFLPAVWGKIYRRSLLYPIQMQVDEKIRLGEDAACSYLCLLHAESIYYLKEAYLYYYRIRENSISHSMVHSYYTEELILLVNSLKEAFERETDMKDVLMKQLYFYTCYMFDNMMTANLTLWHTLFSKKFREQIQIFTNSRVGKESTQFCSTQQTSSRTRRLLKVTQKDSFANRFDLYCFRKFELLQATVQRIKK